MFLELSKRLKEIDVDQTYLGTLLGLSRSAISRRFTGQTPWDIDEMYKILEILHESPEKLHIFFPRERMNTKPIVNNENSREKRLNEYTMSKYDEIIKLCSEYQSKSIYTKLIAPLPDINERNVFVTLIQPIPAFIANAEVKEILSSLIAHADSVVFANSDVGLSISFCVEGIWEK